MENKNNTFSFSRLFLLARRQIVGNFNGLIISFLAITGFVLFVTLFKGYSQPASLPEILPLFFTLVFVLGFILTSTIFAELHSPQKSIPFLMLPVSKLERLINAWILTAIVFPIVATLTYALILLISCLILRIPLSSGIFGFLVSAQTLKILKIYFITQSVFLFGAVYFRKHNFLKTLLSLFVIQNAIGAILALVVYILFGKLYFNNLDFIIDPAFKPGLEKFFTVHLFEILKFTFYYLTVPFFLVLTWFGIKERQV